MAGVAYYNTGAATVAVNSKTVTGTGTNWLSVVGGMTAIKAGDKFGIHVGRPIIIASVDSNTQLTLEDNWPGPAQTNAAYKIELTSPDVIAVEALRRVLGSLGSGVLYGLSQLPSTPNKSLTIDENGSAALADLSPLGLSLIAALNSSSARDVLGLAIGSNVQAYDLGLQSIAGLTTSANLMIYTTASDTYATTSLTPFARTILDDADAAAVRGTLGVSQSDLDARYNRLSQTIANSQLPSTMTGKSFSSTVYTANGIGNTGFFTTTSNGSVLSFLRNNANAFDIEAFSSADSSAKHSIDLNRYGGAVTINGQTAWHAGNDGPASGLDADLLDGQQGAYYLDVANFPGVSAFARTVLDDTSGAAMFATMGATFSGSSAAGSAKLPSGLELKWGTTVNSLSDYRLLFPIAFANDCFVALPVNTFDYGGATDRFIGVSTSNVDKNGFDIRARNITNGGGVAGQGNAPIRWLAVGW